MNDTSTHCLLETRRALVRATGRNGLDYVEVGDPGGHAGGGADDPHYLTVYFLGRLHTARDGHTDEWRISPAHFKIAGGRRVTDIRVVHAWVFRPTAADEDDVVVLRVEQSGDAAGVGDFSCYTLEIVKAPHNSELAEESRRPDSCRPCRHDRHTPLADLPALCDQRYRSASFSFKAGCPSTVDCVQPHPCAEPRTPPPAINYLARDYHAFRELILDRLSLTLPQWRERHTPDVGIAVAEIMAYAADRLSYHQDAVGQEAYLGTARRRISVRRHARLVDYILHEGCNARAWVCCTPDTPLTLLPQTFDLRTAAAGESDRPLVFEPLLRQRGELLERGDFFDLRSFVWKILHGQAEEVAKRLSACLLRDLERRRKRRSEKPLPESLAERLLAELNERVLLDQTYAAAEARAGDLAEIARLNRAAFDQAHSADCVALHGIFLHPAHETIQLHTWRNKGCCLEAGATGCVLVDGWTEPAAAAPVPVATDCHCPPPELPDAPPRGRRLRLRQGDVLVFEEIIGPQTGNPADADKSRRHAVRLTAVVPEVDLLDGTPVLRVRWAAEDALPFSFCLSRLGPPPECRWLDGISVASGNVVLVDHGETRLPEELGQVGREDPDYRCRCAGVLDEISVRARPFSPDLDQPDLTFAVPLAVAGPAAGALDQKPWQAVAVLAVESLPPVSGGAAPALTWAEWDSSQAWTGSPADHTAAGLLAERRGVSNLLRAATQQGRSTLPPLEAESVGDPQAQAKAQLARRKFIDGMRRCLGLAVRRWQARPDLLRSGPEDRHFVIEMDDERRGQLRFGRDGSGRVPEAGEIFRCRYRTGNGPSGNTGAETIAVFHPKAGRLGEFTVRNPLPARGGSAPEAPADAKRHAPHVFRLRQLRAVTAADYARLAEKNPRVQRAGAEIRWTGSRQCVRVAIDSLGLAEAPADLIAALRDELLVYRRIGHDLEIVPALHVAVDLKLDVCVQPWALRGDVEMAVRDALTAGLRRDGAQGFFHPDRLTFGEPVRASRIVAAVQPLPGVMSVRVAGLTRFGRPPCRELDEGLLAIGPLEVARLDNDPDFPEHGNFTLNLGGGR